VRIHQQTTEKGECGKGAQEGFMSTTLRHFGSPGSVVAYLGMHDTYRKAGMSF